jgi:hypothetical protein
MVLVGPNGTGKSTVLEAFALLSGRDCLNASLSKISTKQLIDGPQITFSGLWESPVCWNVRTYSGGVEMASEYAPPESPTAFLLECISGSDSRQSKDYSGIGHHRIGPAFVGSFLEEVEVVLSHLNIDL